MIPEVKAMAHFAVPNTHTLEISPKGISAIFFISYDPNRSLFFKKKT
jgi:hypothetical protein